MTRTGFFPYNVDIGIARNSEQIQLNPIILQTRCVHFRRIIVFLLARTLPV